jgi:hypothetical protein
VTDQGDRRRQQRDREALHRQLLAHHRVRRLVHGRAPVEQGELTRMLATATGISVGLAEAAVRRAVEVGEVLCWVTVAPASGGGGPDPDRVLDELQEGAAMLERARRAAGEASEG